MPIRAMSAALLLVLLAGCASHWSDSYGELYYPHKVGYEHGVESETSNGAAAKMPVKLLTSQGSHHDIHPRVFTHDGVQWLYFSSDRDGEGYNIYRKKLQARAVQQLTYASDDEFWPTVSPDGRWLAYGGNNAGDWNLYLLDLQTMTPPQRLTTNTADEAHPDWAADSQRLIYTRWSEAEQNWLIHGLSFEDDLAVNPRQPPPIGPGPFASVDGDAVGDSSGVEVTGRTIKSHWSLMTNGQSRLRGLHPRWHPTFERILLQDERRVGKRWFTVRSFDLGTGLTQTLSPPSEYGAIQPTYTPGGNRVLFVSVSKSDNNERMGDGFSMVDGNGQMMMDIRNPVGHGRLADPQWITIDGQPSIIFSLKHEVGESIYIVGIGRGA